MIGKSHKIKESPQRDLCLRMSIDIYYLHGKNRIYFKKMSQVKKSYN